MDIAIRIGHALLTAAGMLWQVGWSLVLGFLISAALQVFVPKEKMAATLGANGPKQIALAAAFGAASSSCSYASAAITRTLLQKGAGFIPSLAFLFASTNLVIELGLILCLLMGWQFMAAEWLGGIVLVVIMSFLVRLTYPAKLVEEARRRASAGMERRHDAAPLHASPFSREARIDIARSFIVDWSMLGKDLLAGFLIAGFLAEFVPGGVWRGLFATHAPAVLQLPLGALIGPLVAVFSFVCSIGNVPMAAILWSGGVGFGGVLAFLYADLIVLPLLDVYRRSFGWKMAAYIGAVFYVTMAATGMLMDAAFHAFGLVPQTGAGIRAPVTHFAVNYTFWLNLIFGTIAVYAARLAKSRPGSAAPCCEHHRH